MSTLLHVIGAVKNFKAHQSILLQLQRDTPYPHAYPPSCQSAAGRAHCLQAFRAHWVLVTAVAMSHSSGSESQQW